MTCRRVSVYLGWGSHGEERDTVPSSWKTLREPQPAMQLCIRKYCLVLHQSQNIHFKGTEKAHAVQIPNWNINKDFYNSYGGAWAAKQMICCCCTPYLFLYNSFFIGNEKVVNGAEWSYVIRPWRVMREDGEWKRERKKKNLPLSRAFKTLLLPRESCLWL